MEQEALHFDVIIVGAGPAGLSAAIRLKQLAQAQERELSVCILEKGASVGAHILSGAVLEPRALDELLPNWRELDAPITNAVTQDAFYLLTTKQSWRLPTPPQMRNHGNYIISLGEVCRWLATIAESLGVEIFPGFAGAELLIEDAKLVGVKTGAMGLDKHGEPAANYQPSMAIYAKQTLLAEGCRGSLTKQACQHFQLLADSAPQTYALGIKEVWRVDSPEYAQGSVFHSLGWPLDKATYGGAFIYHLPDNQVAFGFVIGLDYANPHLDIFQESQRFKTHPQIAPLFQGGERLSYGARTLNEGGLQAIPKLTFPGGALIGCAAGFLNVPKIKGTHTAMKSAMLAAEAVFASIEQEAAEAQSYTQTFQQSWAYDELHKARNIRPAFRYGLWAGLAYAALDTYILRGHAPWTFSHKPDHKQLQVADNAQVIDYPKADGKLTFDKLSSVYLTNVFHREDQPCHLKLADAQVPININFKQFASPETRYCPAAVYEIVYTDDQEQKLNINAQNCIHCKACDIKDPRQNITWVPPEGGGGPNYTAM